MNEKAFDVIVIGGGVSGIAAAIAAAEKKVSVCLIEKSSMLGGKATAAYVGTICGAFLSSKNKESKYVSAGFMKKFVDTLASKSETKAISNTSGLHFLPYDQFAMKMLCDELIKESDVALFLQSQVVGIQAESANITSVDLIAYDKNLRLQCKTLIDCSGDAIAADLLHIDTIRSDQYQAAAKVFTIENLEIKNPDSLSLSLIRHIKKAKQDALIQDNFTQISIVPGSIKETSLTLKIGIPTPIDHSINRMTKINIESRQLINQITSVLKSNMQEFRNCRIGNVAPEVGIRTGKRHLGKKILSYDDIKDCRKSDDGVARGSWPIEHWNYTSTPHMEFFKLDDYYDISADCLCSNQIENLYFAGRNISADDQGIASARVIGTSLQTGYAAGLIAASKINGTQLDNVISEIQAKRL